MIDQVGFNHLPNNESKTMNSVLHKANTRGHANHGWLQANHSFSFTLITILKDAFWCAKSLK